MLIPLIVAGALAVGSTVWGLLKSRHPSWLTPQLQHIGDVAFAAAEASAAAKTGADKLTEYLDRARSMAAAAGRRLGSRQIQWLTELAAHKAAAAPHSR